VYYAITWTILAYIFFDNMIIIAIGILAMSYGDGIASLIGSKYGKKIYNISGDKKSIMGSIAMFIFTFIMIIIAILIYINIFSYDIIITYELILYLFLISIIAAILEGITPKGLDNITVPLLVSFSYWILIV
jgi:dolichol kinase